MIYLILPLPRLKFPLKSSFTGAFKRESANALANESASFLPSARIAERSQGTIYESSSMRGLPFPPATFISLPLSLPVLPPPFPPPVSLDRSAAAPGREFRDASLNCTAKKFTHRLDREASSREKREEGTVVARGISFLPLPLFPHFKDGSPPPAAFSLSRINSAQRWLLDSRPIAATYSSIGSRSPLPANLIYVSLFASSITSLCNSPSFESLQASLEIIFVWENTHRCVCSKKIYIYIITLKKYLKIKKIKQKMFFSKRRASHPLPSELLSRSRFRVIYNTLERAKNAQILLTLLPLLNCIVCFFGKRSPSVARDLPACFTTKMEAWLDPIQPRESRGSTSIQMQRCV